MVRDEHGANKWKKKTKKITWKAGDIIPAKH